MPMDAKYKKTTQCVAGKLHYYDRDVDSTVLVDLGSLSTSQSKGIKATIDSLL